MSLRFKTPRNSVEYSDFGQSSDKTIPQIVTAVPQIVNAEPQIVTIVPQIVTTVPQIVTAVRHIGIAVPHIVTIEPQIVTKLIFSSLLRLHVFSLKRDIHFHDLSQRRR